MKTYTKKQNAFYWTVTSILCGVGITAMLLIYELIEFVFS